MSSVLITLFLNIFNFVPGTPINNAVIVSGEQLKDSATHTHGSILPQTGNFLLSGDVSLSILAGSF